MKIITGIEKRGELIYTTERKRQYIYLQQQHRLLQSKKQDAYDYYKYKLTIVVRATTTTFSDPSL